MLEEVKGYVYVLGQNAGILAVIDGTDWLVPDDMDNADRQKIAAWEEEGNTIPDYEGSTT